MNFKQSAKQPKNVDDVTQNDPVALIPGEKRFLKNIFIFFFKFLVIVFGIVKFALDFFKVIAKSLNTVK